MIDWMGFLQAILSEWFKLIASPFVTDFNLMWIIIPIYLNWIVTEITQEKKETSLGNAVTNGVVALWVGLDWLKTTLANSGVITGSDILKYSAAAFMLFYGSIIIIFGIKGKKIIKLIGRIREITYFSVVLTPIIYNVVEINMMSLLAITLFLPVFYLITEIILRIIPTPAVFYEEEEGGAEKEEKYEEPKMEEPAFGKEEGLSPEIGGEEEGLEFPKEESSLPKLKKESPAQSAQPLQPAVQQTSYQCPTCGGSLEYVSQYQRYYCPSCNQYV